MPDRFPLIPKISMGLPPVVAVVLVIGAVARLAVINAGVVLPLFADQPTAQQTPAHDPVDLATHRLEAAPHVSMFDPTAAVTLGSPEAPVPFRELKAGSLDAWPTLLATRPVPDQGDSKAVMLDALERSHSETFRGLPYAQADGRSNAGSDDSKRASRVLEDAAGDRLDKAPTSYKSIQYFEIDRSVPCTAG